MRWLATLPVWLVLTLAGCGEDPAAKVYFLDGRITELGPRGQLLGVERSGLRRPADLVRALLAGPEPAETRRGLVTTIDLRTRLVFLQVAGGTARVDLAGPSESPGLPGPDLDGAAQIVYTLTELPGIRRVALRFEGDPCCVYRHDGRPVDEPLTRRTFRGWGGEPCEFRETPAPTCD